jgi:hypothetical protein
MNRAWFITGTNAGGLEEDYVQLHVSPKGVLLVFIIKRDVDDQVSEPPDLTQADFSSGPAKKVSSLIEFQKLVDENFKTPTSKHKVGRWFELGVQQANEAAEDEDEGEYENDYEEEQDEE